MSSNALYPLRDSLGLELAKLRLSFHPMFIPLSQIGYLSRVLTVGIKKPMFYGSFCRRKISNILTTLAPRSWHSIAALRPQGPAPMMRTLPEAHDLPLAYTLWLARASNFLNRACAFHELASFA